MIAHRDVKAFYDCLGCVEDWLAVIGDRAIDVLIRHGKFDDARAVCELGCGTGRLAARLLRDHVAGECRYLGFDLSTTMARLARKRLRPWSDRAVVVQADAAPRIPLGDGVVDRFIATYVIEIFDDDEARAVLREAHRVLAKGGLACLTSLGRGQTPLSRLVCGLRNRVYAWRPAFVGGCRPIALRPCLPASDWSLTHHSVITRWGFSCEVVVAERV